MISLEVFFQKSPIYSVYQHAVRGLKINKTEKMNFLLSKFKPFVAVTRKPLVLSRISIIFSFNYLFWLFFLLFLWLLWPSSSVFCQDLVRKYFKSDFFRRYISKKILFVREINWIFVIAAKPFFWVENIILKHFP